MCVRSNGTDREMLRVSAKFKAGMYFATVSGRARFEDLRAVAQGKGDPDRAPHDQSAHWPVFPRMHHKMPKGFVKGLQKLVVCSHGTSHRTVEKDDKRYANAQARFKHLKSNKKNHQKRKKKEGTKEVGERAQW